MIWNCSLLHQSHCPSNSMLMLQVSFTAKATGFLSNRVVLRFGHWCIVCFSPTRDVGFRQFCAFNAFLGEMAYLLMCILLYNVHYVCPSVVRFQEHAETPLFSCLSTTTALAHPSLKAVCWNLLAKVMTKAWLESAWSSACQMDSSRPNSQRAKVRPVDTASCWCRVNFMPLVLKSCDDAVASCLLIPILPRGYKTR